MGTIEIKWGLGNIKYRGIRQNIKLWHLLIDGHTIGSYLSEKSAKAAAYDYLKKNPQKIHDTTIK